MQRRAISAMRAERGMTLVETLVAMVTGIVVLGAIFVILEAALHQTARLTDYVQANQASRSAMRHIVDELHSSCISSGFKPVQEGSTESKLIFINAYSEKAEITAGEKTRKDEISWASEKLTDKTYRSTSGSWPEFKFSTSASPENGVLLGEHIATAELENPETKAKETPPIFRYYDYATKASNATGEPVSTLVEAKPPASGFTAAEAEKVAAVQVSFKTGPASGSKSSDRYVDLTDQVTFAFSAARSEAVVQDAPCE